MAATELPSVANGLGRSANGGSHSSRSLSSTAVAALAGRKPELLEALRAELMVTMLASAQQAASAATTVCVARILEVQDEQRRRFEEEHWRRNESPCGGAVSSRARPLSGVGVEPVAREERRVSRILDCSKLVMTSLQKDNSSPTCARKAMRKSSSMSCTRRILNHVDVVQSSLSQALDDPTRWKVARTASIDTSVGWRRSSEWMPLPEYPRKLLVAGTGPPPAVIYEPENQRYALESGCGRLEGTGPPPTVMFDASTNDYRVVCDRLSAPTSTPREPALVASARSVTPRRHQPAQEAAAQSSASPTKLIAGDFARQMATPPNRERGASPRPQALQIGNTPTFSICTPPASPPTDMIYMNGSSAEGCRGRECGASIVSLRHETPSRSPGAMEERTAELANQLRELAGHAAKLREASIIGAGMDPAP